MGSRRFLGETANNKIDVSSLKEGLYILKSVTDKGMLIQKVLQTVILTNSFYITKVL
jgi:hypothetical protein